MTKEQLEILRPAINAVAHHNKHAWDRLKCEVFDYGQQSFYPAQSFFELPAEAAVNSLTREKKAVLVESWKRNNLQDINKKSDQEILNYFSWCIVLEIVSRARRAAYRRGG